MGKEKTKVIATRVNVGFAGLIEDYCRQNAYINCSDLVRDALREKFQKEIMSTAFRREIEIEPEN